MKGFDLVGALLETQALRLASPGEVFWYTSGTVGPYYINTHYLYGGPEAAEELLSFIDAHKGEDELVPALCERVERQAAADPTYRAVIDLLVERARGDGEIDAVSGGERRDWFFSIAVAARLHKPHLSIGKDGRKLLFDGRRVRHRHLDGLRTLHVADLVTEASSYFRTWIPAVAEGGGRLVRSVNVVDRGQGGLEALAAAGVAASALLRVDEALFARLRESGHIDGRQHQLLCAYQRDPHAAMRAFLQQHPDFVRAALEGEDPRARARARLLLEQNVYGLEIEK